MIRWNPTFVFVIPLCQFNKEGRRKQGNKCRRQGYHQRWCMLRLWRNCNLNQTSTDVITAIWWFHFTTSLNLTSASRQGPTSDSGRSLIKTCTNITAPTKGLGWNPTFCFRHSAVCMIPQAGSRAGRGNDAEHIHDGEVHKEKRAQRLFLSAWVTRGAQ